MSDTSAGPATVFAALGDPTRLALVGRLSVGAPLSIARLAEGSALTRQAVTKHLSVLEAANLVASERRGREKLHYLNAVPIQEIADRWIGKYERGRLAALAGLKRRLEGETDG